MLIFGLFLRAGLGFKGGFVDDWDEQEEADPLRSFSSEGVVLMGAWSVGDMISISV
jgi:hypothetical protein